jgi:protein TonB
MAAGLGIATAQATAGPVRVSSAVAQANRVKMVQPQYPQGAKQAGIQGTVRMDVVIDKGGKVRNIAVLSGPDTLTETSVTAVSQWEYRPTLLNGEPVEIITEVVVNFTLAN